MSGIGTSNRTKLSYIKEVTPGVTPDTPAMQLLRYTGETLQSSNSTTVSAEIRSDRATADLVLTDQTNSGDINCELSGTTYDDFFEAALFADDTWTVPVAATATTIASTVSGFTDSGNGFISAAHLEAGQFVKVSGFANPLINIVYELLTVSAGVITTYPAPAAAVAAGAAVKVSGSTIKNGVTDHSFTIQKTFADLADESYVIFRGARISTMKIDLAVGALAKIAFGFMAVSGDTTETQISGLTEDDPTTTSVMNCVSDVTSIIARSTGITTTLYFTDLSLSYDNKLRELKAIGRLGSIDIRAGTIEAKATINPYLENIELLTAFLNNDSFTLAFQMTGSDGYSYVFSYPKVKFNSQDISAGAKDQDMIIKGEVQAILDPASLSMMRIDRFVP